MMMSLEVLTKDPACHNITDDLVGLLCAHDMREGVLSLMMRHTSCPIPVQ